MTNLEINQAVYQAMCKIADKWFKFSVEKCEKLREKMEEKPQITAKEFYAVAKGEYVSQWDIAKSDYDESKAQQMLCRIANSVERNNKNDEYFVQHIGTVSIVDEKGGMLWARR